MPNVARIYDFLLGGTENHEEDRRAAEKLLEAVPDAAVAAWDNREFLGRVVRFLAEEAGIRQFIDIGTGLPTRGSVHAICRQVASDARVAYIDSDPEVITHARRLLTGQRNVIAVEGDLRNPLGILSNPELRNLIDLDEPMAILLIAVLHFIKDDQHPYNIVDQLSGAMAPGSYLALSHVSGDNIAPDALLRIRTVYEDSTAPGVARSREEIMRFLNGLEIVPPGLVNVASWRPDWLAAEPGRTIFYAGVGKKAMHDKHGDVDTSQESVTAIRAMAGLLTERGFDVRRPDRAIGYCLTVANAKRARCQIDVDDNDRLGWEYISCSREAAEPSEISDVVLGILCGDSPGSDESYDHLHRGVTLKGAVGREMQARGLDVKLNTYEDETFFEAVADIEITNPARPERGFVFVADDGIVQWELLEYQSEAEAMAAVADTTARVLNGGPTI